MDTLSVIGLILAVIVLVIGAYRGLGALPLTLLASLVVILTSRISIWTGFSQYYMNGYTSAYFSYFLLFCSSALYAKLMDISGCATSIGYQFIDWFGKNSFYFDYKCIDIWWCKPVCCGLCCSSYYVFAIQRS